MDVNQIIADADAAMESVELDRALSLYSAASSILKGHVQLQVPEANPLLLARVLLKLGEVKVSLEDPEGARQDFVFATSLIEKDDDDIVLETHEIRAGLWLYLGQLSSEQEALAAFRKGIEELEACVRLLENKCHEKQTVPMLEGFHGCLLFYLGTGAGHCGLAAQNSV